MGRLPGFLFTRAKNDRKESSLWKRDLSFSLLFYLSFSFFHSSPFFPFDLIVDFSRFESQNPGRKLFPPVASSVSGLVFTTIETIDVT